MKPSIFSREYEKKMKRRRRMIVFIVVLVVIIGVGFLLSDKINTIGKKAVNKINSKSSTSQKENKPVEKKQEEVKQGENKNQVLNKETEEKGFDVTLSDGTKIKAIYEIKDNDNKFKYISAGESKVNYNISPSGKGIILQEEKTQNMIYIDINGKVENVTKVNYTASDNSIYSKDEQLIKNPNYLWSITPKFINEDSIVYISQLPWFSKNTKYVWMANVRTKEHYHLEGIEGETLNFGSNTEKGLEVILGDKTKYIKADGKISD